MPRFKSCIIFKDLKKISNSINKNDQSLLIEYINSFKGDNIFEKFRNILIAWENDVSYTLDLVLNNLPSSVQLSYIISELPHDFDNNIVIKTEDIEIILDIPKNYGTDIDIIPIYDIIQYIKFSNISINLLNLSIYERQLIINNLPAKVYNNIFNNILRNESKILSFSNPILSKLRINFLTNEPLMVLSKMFSKYSDDYYRDVIFHLSKRMDGKILMNSTPIDIEYYMDKYAEEIKIQNQG